MMGCYSFRIGDMRLLCHSLVLSGPDDFAILLIDWEVHKVVWLSSASSSSSSTRTNPNAPTWDPSLRRQGPEEPTHSADPELPTKEQAMRDAPIGARERPPQLDVLQSIHLNLKKVAGEGGNKGVCPPLVLKPPPSPAIPSVCHTGSTWDILASFAPGEQEHAPARKSGGTALEHKEDKEGAVVLRWRSSSCVQKGSSHAVWT
jgi:mitogen-activated protein kinase kinase kinase 1